MTTITVMGATGRTGGAITQRLLAQGVHVRALGRSEQRLAALRQQGADTRAGDARDVAYLTQAFSGADAVYTLMPHDPAAIGYVDTQREQGQAVAEALRVSGVRRAVCLSSLGAELPDGTGVIQSLHEQEQRLRAIASLNVLFLRPGMFFEAITAGLPLIKSAGVLVDALAPDLPVPMLSTEDIAEVAARELLARDWKGVDVRELHGPCDLTCNEAARILGVKLGLPGLAYVQLPYDAMTHALIDEAGFAPDVAALTVDMERALNEGHIRPLQARSVLTATPTTFEQFADSLVEVYQRL
jgi:uncharacterized protein YbjT (DUF2867 family)